MDYVAIVTLELNGNTYNKGDVIAPADVPTTKLRSLVDKGLIDAVNSVGDIADGSIAPAKVTGTAVVTNDARLSDTRTPTDSSVTNAKVNASAAIAVSKLAAGSEGETVSTVSGVPTWASVLPADQVANVVAKAAVGNLLIANLANGSESGSVAADEPVDCSVASSTAQAKSGTRSIAQTAAAAYCYARMTDVTGFTAGQTYTFSAQARANASGETAEVTVLWRDSGGAGIGSVVSVNAAVVSTGWTRLINTTVAPAGAVTATIYLGKSGANGTVLYWDELGAWQGAGGQWDLPGTPITNLGFYTDESVGRRLFQWDANNSRWQMTYGDTGWRDVSADLINSYTGTVYLRRIGNVIHFVGQVTRATSNGALNVPTGFRPTQDSTRYPYFATRSSTTGALAAVTVDSQIYIYGVDSNAYPISGSYIAGDAWPTTLPGTASGSIPA